MLWNVSRSIACVWNLLSDVCGGKNEESIQVKKNKSKNSSHYLSAVCFLTPYTLTLTYVNLQLYWSKPELKYSRQLTTAVSNVKRSGFAVK